MRRHAPKAGAPELLLFHGNGEVVADWDAAAPHFASAAGVNLVVADYPGYGQSEGEPTLRGIITGAAAVADAVRPYAVMGRSLGSACANELIGQGRAYRHVLESGFVDLAALVRRRGLSLPEPFEPEPLFDPLSKLRRGQGRLLVLHGADDALISAEEARAAFAAAAMPDKELVLIPGRGHNDLSFAPEYWRALAAFLG